MIRTHNIFYKIGNMFRVYNPISKTFKTIDYNEKNTLSHKYEVMQGYDASDEGIVEYYIDFKKWNNELSECSISKFTDYYNNDFAVLNTFNKFSNKNIYSKSIIGNIESDYFESCHNGGLAFCINGTYKNCYGYDYSSFYPRILGSKCHDLKLPSKEGKLMKIDTLDFSNIQYGFYHVKIECDDDRFLKIFKYSKKNVYTHYSLLFAIQHQQEFNIRINLDTDIENNAYIYDEKDLFYSHELFGNWFETLIECKKKYPKNKLIKHLLSSLWGSLSAKKVFFVKGDDELENYDYIDGDYYITDENVSDDNQYYTLMNKNNRYKNTIRLKPFLLSYSRNVMGTIAYKNHFDKIVRIYCDNIVYKSNVDFNVEYMSAEDKTSGNITWLNHRKV